MKKLELLFVFLLALGAPVLVLAAARYSPGETLAPTCAPSDPDCRVATSSPSQQSSYNATSTTATSTFAGGLDVKAINQTGSASSTFANGLQLSAGCFRMPDGICLGSTSGGSGTVGASTVQGQIPFYNSSGTTLTATSSLFLSQAGNLGVGTTTPNWPIEVASTTPYLALTDTNAGTDRKHILLSNDEGIFNIGTSSDTLTSTSSAFSLDMSGPATLGIGTTSPWRTLSVVGTMAIQGLTSSAVGNALCITTANEVTTASVAACSGVSSRRFKHDILDSDLGLPTILDLHPITFRYNEGYGDSGKTQQFGLIAEEVEKIDPRLIIMDSENIPTAVRYDFLPTILVKAVQELSARLEDLARNGIATVKSLVVESLTARTGNFDVINATKICAGQTCVTENELRALLQNQTLVPASTPIVTDSPTPSVTPSQSPSPEASQ